MAGCLAEAVRFAYTTSTSSRKPDAIGQKIPAEVFWLPGEDGQQGVTSEEVHMGEDAVEDGEEEEAEDRYDHS